MSEKNKRGSQSRAEKGEGTQLSLPIAAEKNPSAQESIEKDFEEALAELESLVQRLEGEVKLEEALCLFDRGMQLSKHCESFLKTAEQKIEILKKTATGTLDVERFSEENLSASSKD